MKFLLRNIYFLARVGLVDPLKIANIGYQDLLDKTLGWFFGFESIEELISFLLEAGNEA